MTRACIAVLLFVACRGAGDDDASQQETPSDSGSAATAVAPDTSTPQTTPGVLPLIGVAVSDTAGVWCAEFMSTSVPDSLAAGLRATIVFARPGAIVSLSARVAGRREGECYAAFPQPRWNDYVAYRLEAVESFPADAAERPDVGLIVLSAVQWTRGADSIVRADIDNDGALDELRRCTADEGEHFTLWSAQPGGARVRRWHEYYDWGAFTDPTCRPGEDGR